MKDFISRSRFRLFLLLTVGIALICLGVVAALWIPPQQVQTLRVSGGVPGLNRDAVAQSLRRHSSDHGIEIEVVPTEGTLESLRLIESGELDLAIVNSLVRHSSSDRIRQVASITFEVLHVAVKEEYADQVEADYGSLQSLSINIGPPQSETEMISRALLSFCRIQIDSDEGEALDVDRQTLGQLGKTLTEMEQAEGERRDELRSSLPDVVIHSSTLPSPLAMQLIEKANFRLVPMPFANAFAKVSVEEQELDRDHVDEVHVINAEIPAYLYGVTPAIPAADLSTLGCPLVLVAHRDVSDQAIRRLLPRLYEGPIYTLYRPPNLRDVTPAYPWHSASLAYRDRERPLVRSDVLSAVQLLLSVIAPLLGGCLALYGFYRWRQTLRFLEYFQQLVALDMRAKGLLEDDSVTHAEEQEARQIEVELTRLQKQAVSDFCRNYFHGEGVLENFLQLLSETRAYLRDSVNQTLLEQMRGQRASQLDADEPSTPQQKPHEP